MVEDEGLQQVVETLYATFDAFGEGNTGPLSALWSRDDDVTIFGGFGAYERGWAAVGPRLDWAASRFSGVRMTYEPLGAGSSGDVGYAIGLERGEARLAGQDISSSLVLRVTHLFRREDGEWKIIHRHADPITTKTAPEEILLR